MTIELCGEKYDEDIIQNTIKTKIRRQKNKLELLKIYNDDINELISKKYIDLFKEKNNKNELQLQNKVNSVFLTSFMDRENELVNAIDSSSVTNFVKFVETVVGDKAIKNSNNILTRLDNYRVLIDLINDKNSVGEIITQMLKSDNPKQADIMHDIVKAKFLLPIFSKRINLEIKICDLCLEKNNKLNYQKELSL